MEGLKLSKDMKGESHKRIWEMQFSAKEQAGGKLQGENVWDQFKNQEGDLCGLRWEGQGRRGDEGIGGVGSLEEIMVLCQYFKHLSMFVVLQER